MIIGRLKISFNCASRKEPIWWVKSVDGFKYFQVVGISILQAPPHKYTLNRSMSIFFLPFVLQIGILPKVAI